MARIIQLLTVAFLAISQGAALDHSLPTPSSQLVAERADAPIPTITFRLIESYLVKREDLKDPEPSGDKLQIYPQGIYDDFPKDGVTVVFGPDLKQRISVAIGNNCHTDLTSCRERLMPILQNTDLHTHTKRFILITAFVIGDVVASVSYLLSVAAAAAAGAGTGAWLAPEVPAVRLSYSDLAQIHDLGKADKIAIQQGTDATPTTIVVPAMSEAPAPTGPDFITMETITADSDIAKKGDIVYHIPTDAARRIQDFLAMFGVKSLVDSCEGYDLFNPQKSRVRRGKRANTIEECLRQLNNFNADWIEAVPQNALQLAPQNFPNQPGPGQAVDFPVQGTMVDGVQVVVTTYHVVMQHRRIVQAAPAPVQGLDLNVLAVAAVGLTILTHAIMFAGQVGLKVVLPQSAISRDIRDANFSCPKDILCINDACGAQKSGSEIAQRNAYCTKPKNKGCQCESITYPHHFELERDYMDEQYKWMEELIKAGDNPEIKFEPKCSGDIQQAKTLSSMFKDKIKEMCQNHKNVRENTNTSGSKGNKSWTEAMGEPGVSWGFIFETSDQDKQTTCPFDCETIFMAFADSKDCVKDDGLLKNGEIKTDCGTASYNAYKLGR